MNWWSKLSFRRILLLTPVSTFTLVIVFLGVLGYLEYNTLSNLEQFQSRELSKTQFFINIGNDLARNHVQIYEHMQSAQNTVDEGDFYDKSKPLLLEIHNLEDRIREYINDHSDDYDITSHLKSLLQKLVNYRNNTTNANLMATINLNLAQDLLRESNQYYVELNNHFLEINRFIHNRLGLKITSSHEIAQGQIAYISILSIIFIGSLIVTSIYLSSSLSRNFHERILTLKSLLIHDNPNSISPVSKNEIDILSAVIDNVKFNFENIEYTRNELIEKELRLRKIFDNVIDAIITIDENGIIENLNRAAENIFGYNADEIIGLNISILVPDPHHSQFDEYLDKYLTTNAKKEMNQSWEINCKRKDGTIFPLSFRASEIILSNKRIFVGIMRDITNEKRQEEQLQRTQKMDALGTLTGGIAHDYNNMLSIILGYTTLLQQSLSSDPRLRKYADEIAAVGERGKKLTKQILSLSQHKQADEEIVNINTVLQDQKLMLEKILTPRIQIKLDLVDKSWLVYIDKSDFEGSILNICINAMHAIETGGNITLRTQNEHLDEVDAKNLNLNPGDYVLLSITDTGVGMTKQVQNHIFDPFYTTKGDKGTGLGLSQVHGFVTRSGGAVNVYSEPGHGSSFVLYLPRHDSVVKTALQNHFDDVTDHNGNEKILVVDDEPALLLLSREILGSHGYKVFCANNGAEALNILETNNVDLVISDVIMPEMSGFQLSSIIKERYPNIKIQLVSGFIDEHQLEIKDAALYKNILYKPINSQDLLKHIRELLDQSTTDEDAHHYTVLTMDDDENALLLSKINLEKLGYHALSAQDGKQAISLYRKSMDNKHPIDVIILDLSIKGDMSGIEVAQEILAINPQAKLIVSSGDTYGKVMANYQDYGFKGALEKTFKKDDIGGVIKQVLNTP